jgi:hypothetical protein
MAKCRASARPLPASSLKATQRGQNRRSECLAGLKAAAESVLSVGDKILAVDANGTAQGFRRCSTTAQLGNGERSGHAVIADRGYSPIEQAMADFKARWLN